MFRTRSARVLAFPCLFILLPDPALARDPPVPGEARGTVDGEPFRVPLDCSGWNADQRMVYSADDGRGLGDENGDGISLVFSHFAPASATNGTLVIDGRDVTLNAGFNRGPDAPSWEVSEEGASFSGPSLGIDSAEVEISIDCAPRDAAARGFTGRVSGEIDGNTINEPLFCGAWNGPQAIEARTEDADPRVELFVIRDSGQGTVEVEIGAETYRLVAAPIAGTEFGLSEDRVTFVADLTRRQSGDSYTVDLTFDCTER